MYSILVVVFLLVTFVKEPNSFIDNIVLEDSIHVIRIKNPLPMRTQKEGHYLRLRLRFENKQLQIIHAKKVESVVLVESEINLGTGIIYEVRLNNRRLDLRSIPYEGLFVDLASYHNSKDLSNTTPDSFEFHVRIPLDHFKFEDIEKLSIDLYALTDGFSNRTLNETKVIEQFPNSLQLLAKLESIKIEALIESLRSKLKIIVG
jgi:hypothetical protein